MKMVLTVSFFISACFILLSSLHTSTIQTLDASSVQNANNSAISDSLSSFVATNISESSSETDAGKLQIRYTGLIRDAISPEVARALGLNETYPGLIVTDVIPGSPAEKAGIRGANVVKSVGGEIVRLGGDIIVAADGNSSAVEDREAFLDYLRNEKSIGNNLTLTIIRDGNIKRTNLTIATMPDYFWYINPDEALRIKYPSDWEASDSNLGEGDIIRFLSPELNPDNNEATASVSLKVTPSNGRTLDEFALAEREPKPGIRNLAVNAIELFNQQAYETIFYNYGVNSTQKVKSVFTANGDQIYIISFMASDPSRYDDYLPMAEEMISSFRFDRIEE
jgi:hypothetical protein